MFHLYPSFTPGHILCILIIPPPPSLEIFFSPRNKFTGGGVKPRPTAGGGSEDPHVTF